MKAIRKIAIFAMTLVCVACVAFFASCSKNVTVSFNTSDIVQVESITVKKGEEATLPTPSATGYEFVGWYTDENYSSSAITTIKPDKDTTLYAKWDKLIAITLDLDGGSLSSGTTVYLKKDSTVRTGLANYVPTKTGYEFGAWTQDGKEITASLKASSDITLKAKYKAGYTVQVYLESLDGSSYERGDDIKGYVYTQTNYTPEVSVSGFSQTTHAGEVTTKDVTDTIADNVYVLYFNRKTIQVTYRANYPDGSSASDEVISLKYGTAEAVKTDYECDGYVLIGWSTERGGSVLYGTNWFYLGGKVYNQDESTKTAETLESLSNNTVLYGVWLKGYSNMLSGEDYIYQPDKDSDALYLGRGGAYFKGSLKNDGIRFEFKINSEDSIRGNIVGEQYIYYNNTRLNLQFYKYTAATQSVDGTVYMVFDEYNGVDYVSNGYTSEGTYVVVDDSYYVATFTTGEMQGQSLTFMVTSATRNSSGSKINIFIARNDTELGYGTIPRAAIYYKNNSDGSDGYILTYYTNGVYDITLDGFVTATYNAYNSSSGTITKTTYSYYTSGDTLTLVSSSSSSSRSNFKLITVNGQLCYFYYDSSYDHEYTATDGTLTLDGLYTATYTTNGTTVTGIYRVSSTVRDKKVVTFMGSDNNYYTFLLDSSTVDGVTTYTYEQKAKGYAEYYYSNATNKLTYPLFILNDKTVGDAALYTYTTSGTYKKVSEGTYTLNSDNQYVYTATNTDYDAPADEKTDDLTFTPSQIANVVFKIQGNRTYWYSSTAKSGGATTDYTTDKKTYADSKDTGNTVEIYAGFIFYTVSKSGTTYVGTYKTTDATEDYVALTTATLTKSGSTVTMYFELNDDDNTYVKLDYARFSVNMLKRSSTYSDIDSTITLAFDGKGGAIYKDTTAGETFSGTIAESGSKADISEITIYTFTAMGKTFNFILTSVYTSSTSTTSVFSIYDETEKGNYISASAGILTLDGFGYAAKYVDANGTTYASVCTVDGNVVSMYVNSVRRYFDIDKTNKTFTIRGVEYGSRLYFDNRYNDGTIYALDGYGNVRIYKVDASNVETDIATGTYEHISGNTYKVTYTISSTEYNVVGEIGTYTSGSSSSSKTYNAFYKTYESSVTTFINTKDWSVVTIDSIGGLVKYDTAGKKDAGTYIKITEDLIYFVNSSATDACLYRYNETTGTITQITYSEQAFYATDFSGLLFSKYGYALFNGTDRYYYVIEDETYYLYKRDTANASANAFGYVREEFASETMFESGQKVNWEGTSYSYYDGWSVKFNRTGNTGAYPIAISESSTTKYPFTTLSFTPTGSQEFSTTGTITLNNTAYSCTIVREFDESTDAYKMYVTFGYYHLDINATYLGEDASGAALSTYEITGLSYSMTVYSYSYLYTYYFVYMYFGSTYASQMKNTCGTITWHNVYNEDGDVTSTYIDGVFGLMVDGEFKSSMGFVDQNNSNAAFQSISGATLVGENSNATTPQLNTIYTIEMCESAGYKYRLHFAFDRTFYSMFGVYTYRVYGFNRINEYTQTIGSDTYTYEVETVVSTEVNSYSIGSVYTVSIKKNGTSITINQQGTIEGIWTGITRDTANKTATYYRVTLVANDDAVKDSNEKIKIPATYSSSNLTTEDVESVYNTDGSQFIDINKTDHKIYLLYRNESAGEKYYVVTSCTYDETTQTYTIVANSVTYTVTINGDNKAVITKVDTTTTTA